MSISAVSLKNLFKILVIDHYPLPITHYPLPITHYPLPITYYLITLVPNLMLTVILD
ncbi:hypothetical protein MEO43_09040 [Dolichospermum sp. ST_sed5]|nr:hypothetical protein [Dolichospermum sp. ST_sed5]